MVTDRKDRKRHRFGEEKKTSIVNIFHIYHHLAKYKFECSQFPSSPCWGKKNSYFIIPADGHNFSKSVPLKSSSKFPVL